MATVHQEGGLSFRVYSKDHAPAHVHVWSGSAYAKVTLPSRSQPARLIRIVGKMKAADVARAVEIVQEKSDVMWKAWNRFHGKETDTR